MRILAYILILFPFAPKGFAQSPAGDKDAIELNDSLEVIAQWGNNYDVRGNLNVRYQNPDQWEDFEIITSYGGNSNYGAMRYGGPFIFDSLALGLQAEGDPSAYADLDGDGIGDLITSNVLWYKGSVTPPYFDTTTNVLLRYHDFPSTQTMIGPTDYDADGIEDLLLTGNDDSYSYILFYRGEKHFGANGMVYPTDSLRLPASNYYTTYARYRPSKKPMVLLGWKKAIYIVRNDVALGSDSAVIISDTSENGISVSGLFSMDITGDGIPDLLVSDGLRIYIFKGGDDFGTYPLTAKNAYYVIESPRLLDFGSQYGFIKNFGMRMHACGDLTGSGIPYLAVEAEINESGLYKGFTFFYAGGKALDSLYDAVIGYDNGASIFTDTLHSINSTGRTVDLIYKGDASGGFGFDLLLSNGCDSIPHNTNPRWDSRVPATQAGSMPSMVSYPTLANKFIKLHIESPGRENAELKVYDMLGEVVVTRAVELDAGTNTEYFDTHSWPTGTYVARIVTPLLTQATKFIIDR